MPFEKGKSGNQDGRKKGTPNKNTRSVREMINHLLQENYEQVLKDFKSLTPKERVLMWLKLAEFNVPKLRYYEGQKVIYRVDGLPENSNLSEPEFIEIENNG